VIDRIEHGRHVYRAYFRNAFLKQYEKFSTFLRNELCSNNLTDFGLRKGLDHLEAVRHTFQAITSRFAGFQAQWLMGRCEFAAAPACGAPSGHRPRIRGTLQAIEQRLLVNDEFVLRYETEDAVDGLPPGEGAFLVCSFLLADNYILQGRYEEAQRLFNRLLSRCNDVGLLAEEFRAQVAMRRASSRVSR
jgi:hypothetical protein